MLTRIRDWFEHRTGLISGFGKLLHERIPGGPRWSYVFGSALAITFAIQAITGVLLAFHFSPSASDAWGSVYFIQHEVTLGWMVRGLHHFGSSAMIVLIVLHMVQVFMYGAYKAPREVNWLSGVLLLGLVLGFSLTGYLLPWDQKGYWATKVATNIMGGLPLIGETLQTLAQGGSDYGNTTLTRFYAIHVFVLPGGMIAIMLLHIALMRRHGVTPAPHRSQEELDRTAGWFWPTQALMDVTLGLIVLALVLALTLWLGAPLDAPADPASNYNARPEWYFLFLFQLLKFFEGPLVIIGTVILPGLGALFLILLPFLDRGDDKSLGARKLWAVLFFGGVAGVFGLTALAWVEDGNNPDYQAELRAATRNAKEAVHYAGNSQWGIDSHGKVVLYEGKKIFRREQCGECHVVAGEGEAHAPQLDAFLSRGWIKRLIKNPNIPEHFGLTKLKYDDEEATGMPPQDELNDEQLGKLTEFLASLSGENHNPPIDRRKAAAGKALFDDGECAGCHELTAEEGNGPSLLGYGSREWLKGLLRNPSNVLYYGELGDEMPPFDHLSESELQYLTTWLLNLKQESEIRP